jgi:hypothetical protein
MYRQYRKPASCRQHKVDPASAVLPVRRDDALAAIHQGLHGLATELGLLVAVQLLEDEVQCPRTGPGDKPTTPTGGWRL